MNREPHIAYDARFSLGNYRGMGRYLRTLIAGREEKLLGLCATGESDPALRLVAGGFHSYPLWEQVSIPSLLRKYDIDTFLAPYNTAPLWLPSKTRLIIIVHDLIYLEPLPASKSLYQNAGKLYRSFVTPRALQQASVILTVSHYTASQIQTRFAIEASKIRIIPNSLKEEWYEPVPAIRRTPRTILAVSGEAPSKNLERALQAFALVRGRLRDPNLRMVVAGVKPRFHAHFQQCTRAEGAAEAVSFLPYLSDQEVRLLYRRASVFLMPSLAEGFGIPVLEAMCSGVPVACSNASSLPEVGGDAAEYFDPTSIEQMASALMRVLSDAELASRMTAAGYRQAQRFRARNVRAHIESFWAEVAPQTGSQESVAC